MRENEDVINNPAISLYETFWYLWHLRGMVYNELSVARKAALKLSGENPRAYVTITPAFGWMVTVSKRLNVFAPSDSTEPFGRTGTYWLNGVEKPFTQKQKIADQNKTPLMR